MSRIGKKPIPLPSGVKVEDRRTIGSDRAQGQADGADSRRASASSRTTACSRSSAIATSTRRCTGSRARWRPTPSRASPPGSRASWISWASATAPTSRASIATFTLGYSHPIEVLLPDGVDLKIDKQTHLVLSGYDRQLLGQVAANIRALRKPDPYKNKGIRYTGEALRKKVGKTGASAK